MRFNQRASSKHRRRAAVAAQIAVCSTVILGMGALVLDIGSVYTTQTELQATADAVALAAASELGGNAEDPKAAAAEVASRFAGLNQVQGQAAAVSSVDLEFGRAVYDSSSGKFIFQPDPANADAVRIRVHRVADGSQVVVPFLFAPIFGLSCMELGAQATAVLIPRDIAVVIDLSGSMNDDSELRHYKRYQGEQGDWRDGIQVNLRDVWCALNGPAPSRPYIPGAEDETEYADDTGPTIGVMSTWGQPIVPETYDPVADTGSDASGKGLWYLKKGVNVSAPTLAPVQASLAARGYTADEIACLVSGSQDSSTTLWRNRVATILGLATWRSGRPGGMSGGDGDAKVEDAELVWLPYPSFRSSGGWTWANFVEWVGGSSQMTTTNPNFQYRYGLKTFTNFLLENRPRYNQTNILWQTPEQPLQAVKDAVQAMTDVILGLDSLDHMSLEIFAQTARHEVDLTENLQAVPDRLYRMQAAHYDNYTNMGAGLLTAINELTSSRARSASAKVIVMMSDGKPNIDENGNYGGEGAPAIVEWVKEVAQQAADLHIRIYTISVGGDADQDLMSEMATIGGGQHFHAEGAPEEYSDQLELIFRTLGGRRPVALIE